MEELSKGYNLMVLFRLNLYLKQLGSKFEISNFEKIERKNFFYWFFLKIKKKMNYSSIMLYNIWWILIRIIDYCFQVFILFWKKVEAILKNSKVKWIKKFIFSTLYQYINILCVEC